MRETEEVGSKYTCLFSDFSGEGDTKESQTALEDSSMYRYLENLKNTGHLQKLRILKRAVEAWCMVMVLIMNRGVIAEDQLSTRIELKNSFEITLAKLSESIVLDGVIPLVLFIIFFTFYWQIARIPFRKNIWSHLTAGIFSAFVVVGYSFATVQSLDLIFADAAQMIKSLIAFVGFYGLLHPCIKLCYLTLDNREAFQRGRAQGRAAMFFDRYPFRVSFAVLVIAWLPYLIGYYPGLFMGDTGAQLSQFFQIPNGTSSYLNLISESQLINNHHPVFHTVLMGTAVKLGRVLFHSDNAGIFLYTCFQYLCTAGALAYGISWLKKIRIPRWCQITFLGIAALYPVIGRYAVLLSKDTLFADCMLLYMVFLAELVYMPSRLTGKKGRLVLFGLVILGVMLLRQNGIYAVLFSIPVFLTLLRERKHLIRAGAVLLAAVVLYTGYSQALLPALKITPGSRREMLSVPFQQTARYLRDYPDEVTQEEKDAINRVLDADRIGQIYDPNISDPVKATFREDADGEDLKAYFKAWASMLFKHPRCYVEATLNNYYGYFYMGQDATDRRVRYYEGGSKKFIRTRMDNKGFSFSHLKQLEGLRQALEVYSETVLHLPILSILQASAWYTWLVILGIGYLLWKKRWRCLFLFLPALSVLLVSVISPVNGTIYFRYMLSVMFMMPVLIGITVKNEELREIM